MSRVNHLTIFSLSSHFTRKQHSIVEIFMESHKVHYSEAIRQYVTHTSKRVAAFDTVELFKKAHLRVETEEISVNVFELTLIYPLHKNILSYADNLAIQIEAEKTY